MQSGNQRGAEYGAVHAEQRAPNGNGMMADVHTLWRRDGLERVQVSDSGTLADLWAAVSEALHIPLERMALSKDPKLVSRVTRTPRSSVSMLP